MALRTQQMAKEIPQDVLLSLLSPHIYTRACVCTKHQSILRRYFCETLWSLFPLNNISLPIFTTGKIQPGQGAREGMGEHLSIHGFATHL